MANGNGNGNGPWWVKLISAVGVPSAIALGLVYWVTQVQGVALEDHADEAARQMRVLTAVTQQICANTAPTSLDRQGCFRMPPE